MTDARRGFSLIEVLIAVIILAFALLGLGVVIPVVIHAQRQAGDATLSLGATSRAIEWIEGQNSFGTTQNPAGFGNWLYVSSWSSDFGWVEAGPDELLATTGRFALARGAGISMFDRCWPGSVARPRFVWDFIARRMDTADGEPERLQFAIFVRAADTGREVTYGALHTKDPDDIPDRLAIGVTSTGTPTLNGRGEYSRVRTLRIRLNSVKRDRIEILGGQDAVLTAQAKQPGQKLVDNLGNVFTVVGSPSDMPTMVLIQPTLPSWLSNGDARVFEAAFTPHVPASVAIVNLGPK